jgi:hypothetical protein
VNTPKCRHRVPRFGLHSPFLPLLPRHPFCLTIHSPLLHISDVGMQTVIRPGLELQASDTGTLPLGAGHAAGRSARRSVNEGGGLAALRATLPGPCSQCTDSVMKHVPGRHGETTYNRLPLETWRTHVQDTRDTPPWRVRAVEEHVARLSSRKMSATHGTADVNQFFVYTKTFELRRPASPCKLQLTNRPSVPVRDEMKRSWPVLGGGKNALCDAGLQGAGRRESFWETDNGWHCQGIPRLFRNDESNCRVHSIPSLDHTLGQTNLVHPPPHTHTHTIYFSKIHFHTIPSPKRSLPFTPIRATRPSHSVLHHFNLKLLREEFKLLNSSLRSFLRKTAVTILQNTFPTKKTPSSWPKLNVRDN